MDSLPEQLDSLVLSEPTVLNREQLEALVLRQPPPLDPDFLQWEKHREQMPALPIKLEERQTAFAEYYRDLTKRCIAEGARDHDLSKGLTKKWFTIESTLDSYSIPVMQLDLTEHSGRRPEVVIVFYHGGGLVVGEADTEELSYRRLVKNAGQPVRLYSVGYRLSVPHGADTCLSDAMDCFERLRNRTGKTIIAGSSSGGQLAAAVSQSFAANIHGVFLRGPVTADANSGKEYIPERFRPFHTSEAPEFANSLSYRLTRSIPRDGLDKLPLEADKEALAKLPKTWIQGSTNDPLYSDALCYAMALQEVDVPVRFDVIRGWPHTFWLTAPELPQALEAEERAIEGLKWLLEG